MIALYKTFRGGEWARRSLESIEKHVDAVVAVHSNTCWVPTELENNCIEPFEEWARDTPGVRYHPVGGGFATQEEQYLAGWNLIKIWYPNELVLLIDTDEIWEEADLQRAKAIATDYPREAWCCRMHTYIKESTFRVSPPELCTPVVIVNAALVDHLAGVRGNGLPLSLLPDVWMHHFTGVRDDFADIELKFKTSEAGDGIPYREDWLETVWPKIPKVSNFHWSKGYEYSWKGIEICKAVI